MLQALLLPSGNDAAYAIAVQVGRIIAKDPEMDRYAAVSVFCKEMNKKAKELGSDYIVVGRPITAAVDPVAAYERCVAEFCD